MGDSGKICRSVNARVLPGDEYISVEVISEETLSIYIDNNCIGELIRTPGDDLSLIAGHCIVNKWIRPGDPVPVIKTGEVSGCSQGHVFRSKPSGAIIEKKKNPVINAISVFEIIEKLNNYQPLRRKTKSTHGAAIFDDTLSINASAEDTGRHNALEKAIGKSFLNRTLNESLGAVLSSRVSIDLAMRVHNSGLSIIFSISRPTFQAIDFCIENQIVLACLSPDDRVMVYSNPESAIQ